MGRLDGRVAIVTGGGSGNGLAIASAFAREGALVAIGEVSEERGAAAQASMDNAIYVKTDVRAWEDVDGLISKTVRQFGRLDIMVNNAGVLDGYATCLETSPELFEQVLAINLRGTFFGCKRALQEMTGAGYGKIVNIASVAGLVALGGGLAYTASKHAVIGMTRQIACEYGSQGVRINAICPGPIATNLRQTSTEILGAGAPEMMNKGVGALPLDKLREIVPLGTRGAPEDVANMAVFLASPESDYVTGQTFVVDGGWLAH